jgi:hypothetical protein
VHLRARACERARASKAGKGAASKRSAARVVAVVGDHADVAGEVDVAVDVGDAGVDEGGLCVCVCVLGKGKMREGNKKRGVYTLMMEGMSLVAGAGMPSVESGAAPAV